VSIPIGKNDVGGAHERSGAESGVKRRQHGGMGLVTVRWLTQNGVVWRFAMSVCTGVVVLEKFGGVCGERNIWIG